MVLTSSSEYLPSPDPFDPNIVTHNISSLYQPHEKAIVDSKSEENSEHKEFFSKMPLLSSLWLTYDSTVTTDKAVRVLLNQYPLYAVGGITLFDDYFSTPTQQHVSPDKVFSLTQGEGMTRPGVIQPRMVQRHQWMDQFCKLCNAVCHFLKNTTSESSKCSVAPFSLVLHNHPTWKTFALWVEPTHKMLRMSFDPSCKSLAKVIKEIIYAQRNSETQTRDKETMENFNSQTSFSYLTEREHRGTMCACAFVQSMTGVSAILSTLMSLAYNPYETLNRWDLSLIPTLLSSVSFPYSTNIPLVTTQCTSLENNRKQLRMSTSLGIVLQEHAVVLLDRLTRENIAATIKLASHKNEHIEAMGVLFNALQTDHTNDA